MNVDNGREKCIRELLEKWVSLPQWYSHLRDDIDSNTNYSSERPSIRFEFRDRVPIVVCALSRFRLDSTRVISQLNAVASRWKSRREPFSSAQTERFFERSIDPLPPPPPPPLSSLRLFRAPRRVTLKGRARKNRDARAAGREEEGFDPFSALALPPLRPLPLRHSRGVNPNFTNFTTFYRLFFFAALSVPRFFDRRARSDPSGVTRGGQGRARAPDNGESTS